MIVLFQSRQQNQYDRGCIMAKITDKATIEKLGQKKALKKLNDAGKPEAPKTYIGFVRVSTTRQEERGESVETQMHLINNYCQDNKLPLSSMEIFAESSSKETRPKFAKFLKRIKETKGEVAIIVTRLDRLTRQENLELEYLKKKGKVELHFVKTGQIQNAQSTPADNFMFNMQVLTARLETDMLSSRVKEVRELQLDKGQYLRAAPIGYKNTIDSQGKKTIVPDDKADLVQKVFQRFAKGDISLSELCDYADRIGLKSKNNTKLAKSTLDDMLRRPFYCGYFTDNNDLYEHHYKKLISKDLFEQVGKILQGRSTKKTMVKCKGAKVFVFSGVLKCTCGCHMSTYEKKKSNGKTYRYIKCSKSARKVPCSVKDISEKVFLDQLETEVLRKLAFDKELLALIKPAIKRDIIKQRQEDMRLLSKLQAEKEQEEAKLFKCHEKFVNEELDKEDYEMLKANYKNKILELEEQMSVARISQERVEKLLNKVMKMMKSGLSVFNSSNVVQKNQFLKILVSNCIYDGEKLQISLKKPFCNLLQNGNRTSWQPQPDSNRCSRLERAVS